MTTFTRSLCYASCSMIQSWRMDVRDKMSPVQILYLCFPRRYFVHSFTRLKKLMRTISYYCLLWEFWSLRILWIGKCTLVEIFFASPIISKFEYECRCSDKQESLNTNVINVYIWKVLRMIPKRQDHLYNTAQFFEQNFVTSCWWHQCVMYLIMWRRTHFFVSVTKYRMRSVANVRMSQTSLTESAMIWNVDHSIRVTQWYGSKILQWNSTSDLWEIIR